MDRLHAPLATWRLHMEENAPRISNRRNIVHIETFQSIISDVVTPGTHKTYPARALTYANKLTMICSIAVQFAKRRGAGGSSGKHWRDISTPDTEATSIPLVSSILLFNLQSQQLEAVKFASPFVNCDSLTPVIDLESDK